MSWRWPVGHRHGSWFRLSYRPTETAQDPSPPLPLSSPAAAEAQFEAELSASAIADVELSTAIQLAAEPAATAAVSGELSVKEALRLDANADRLQASGVPTSSASYSFACWVKVAVDRNDFSCVAALEDNAGSQYNELITDGDGTTLAFYDHAGRVVQIGVLTVGSWYFVAWTVGASGALSAYIAAEGASSLTKVTGTAATVTSPVRLELGGTVNASEWLNGTLSRARLWNGVLSDAELDTEFHTEVGAAKTSGLIGDWLRPNALTLANVLTDYSGTTNTLSSSGSWALETAPNVDAITAAQMEAELSATGAASLDLSTAIQAAAEVTGTGSASLELATSIRLEAEVSGTAAASGELSTAIQAAAEATGAASVDVELSTAIRLEAEASSAGAASLELSTSIAVEAEVSGTASASGELSTAIQAAAEASGTASASLELATAITLAAEVSASGSASVDLSTAIEVAAEVTASASVDCDLELVGGVAAALEGELGASLVATLDLSTAIALAGEVSATAAADLDLETAISLAAEVGVRVDPSAPWARWRLDADWSDDSGNGRTLSDPGYSAEGFPRLVPGLVGQARRFTQAGAVSGALPNVPPYLDVPVADLSALLASAYSVTAWLRLQAATLQSIVCWATDGATPAARLFGGLRFNAPNSLLLTTQTPFNGTTVAGRVSTYARTATLLGDWAHVAVTVAPNGNVSGNVRGATVRWYVNGILEFTEVGTGGAGPAMTDLPVSSPTGARLVLAGRQPNRASAGWDPVWRDGVEGDVDEPQWHARALSAAEIAAMVPPSWALLELSTSITLAAEAAGAAAVDADLRRPSSAFALLNQSAAARSLVSSASAVGPGPRSAALSGGGNPSTAAAVTGAAHAEVYRG